MKASTASCRVVAPSSREALRLVREKLGPEAIVLTNKVTAEGVEIVAALEGALAAVAAATPTPDAVAPPVTDLPAGSLRREDADSLDHGSSVLREIHSMRGMIEEQLAGLSWNEAQRRDPVRGHLLRTLLAAGFSARLSKELLSGLPTGQSHGSGLAYVRSAIESRLPMLDSEDAMMEEGGVYALMGPTGVGKTTTTAKLAARCVMRFGPEKLALVTTDGYRIGAYEQLRIYGQILGVSVHAVKDAADLELVLEDLRDKHMVLIDTVGMSQRDRAVSEQIAMLRSASRPVRRLLLLNASSHGDTLNEVIHAYRQEEQGAGPKSLAGCIFTKVDEATHPGVVLDMAIRHSLPVYYVSSGQKVPEHLMLADRRDIVEGAFAAKSPSALFIPAEADLGETAAASPNNEELRAAEAVSERLRAQCQQLIQALTHNAQELVLNAEALSSAHIGFDQARTLWRALNSGEGPTVMSQDMRAHLRLDADACDRHVLLLAGETGTQAGTGPDAGIHHSAVLLSDRTGLPFGALHGLSGLPMLAGERYQREFSKSFVHLLARVPEAGLIAQWQLAGLHWAASAPASLRVTRAADHSSGTLEKMALHQPFGLPRPLHFRGRPALLSVGEMLICPRTGGKRDSSVADGGPPLRCIVRRVVDAASGRLLVQSYLVLSADLCATAHEAAQWGDWRVSAEVHFKLLRQTLAHLAESRPPGDEALEKRILAASQVCTTVVRLQRASQPWAQAARDVLAHLAGRSDLAGRAVPPTVLMEGLGKFMVLLDALAHDAAAQPPLAPTHVARA